VTQLPLSLASPGSRVVVLGSGSAGNVMVVECGGRRLMVDAGFSCKQIEHRLALVGLDGDGIDGIVLTHEHVDHARGAARFARRHGLTVHATAGTLEALGFLDADFPIVVLRSGAVQEIGSFAVEPFAVPHDAREPVGLVVEDESGHRVGLAADLGARSQLAWGRLRDLDALVLETNHDLEMLRSGPYPWPLKQRVAGRHGHLSNREAAEGVPELLCDRLRWIVLYHLSRTNNLPVLAAEAVLEALDREGSATRICVSEQTQPTTWLELALC
jgi:phosphoribosyl 1,2-cyclic phosphodiesterase